MTTYRGYDIVKADDRYHIYSAATRAKITTKGFLFFGAAKLHIDGLLI
jgi:hypothetical protein